ncbi:hypothetical protein KR51_00032160 [Rubidibacter lacunae KORDI 51-2]|uniref:Uncharacterized protein n=1 Tax=Rubidibacter lacunae KORDI 51-2 TaxID=582515 RepID=U5DI45_9CHRO|nr:hypothetical protein KR51_00032160 [Rubidibacter lacunae KORDI 51-2]
MRTVQPRCERQRFAGGLQLCSRAELRTDAKAIAIDGHLSCSSIQSDSKPCFSRSYVKAPAIDGRLSSGLTQKSRVRNRFDRAFYWRCCSHN